MPPCGNAYELFCIAMASEGVLDLSNTLLRCEPCKMYNLTQLKSLLNKISSLFLVYFNTRKSS